MWRINSIRKEISDKVKGDKNVELLKTAPGVGEQTAFAFDAHVDVARFDNAAQVSNYIGLVPRVYMGKAFSVGARGGQSRSAARARMRSRSLPYSSPRAFTVSARAAAILLTARFTERPSLTKSKAESACGASLPRVLLLGFS